MTDLEAAPQVLPARVGTRLQQRIDPDTSGTCLGGAAYWFPVATMTITYASADA